MSDIYMALVVTGIIVLIVGVAYLIQGAPYVVSDDDAATKMVTLAAGYSPRNCLDLGSGNGKLVIALAAKGFKVDGIELNPILVFRSRRAIRKAGLQNKAHIIWGSFWNYDVKAYDLITMYAIVHIMPRLEAKLDMELRSGSIAISNFFKFPNKKPDRKIGKINIYKF